MMQKPTVLVIDDEEAVREAVTDILDLESLSVLAASDGEQGVALFAQRQAEIGLIILDMSMPGLTGHETLRRLKDIDPEIPVLLSSGYSREEVTHSYADLGVTDFLPKPYDALSLIDVVNQYLGKQGSAG